MVAWVFLVVVSSVNIHSDGYVILTHKVRVLTPGGERWPSLARSGPTQCPATPGPGTAQSLSSDCYSHAGIYRLYSVPRLCTGMDTSNKELLCTGL